jgi:cation diffusion facilitator CzcD-associated flavoprotein CzcO
MFVSNHVDVLIVGAGLSGIGAAYHLNTKCAGKSYAILEARDTIGGTWDLFRYPGIRSDSDMYTLGYIFKPWTDAKAIADGPAILDYIKDTAREYGIDRHIQFHTRVVGAAWDSQAQRWTVDLERGPDRRRDQITAGFVFLCAGYYRYESGFDPDFAGRETYQGRIVHPQKWTDDIEWKGKRVVVIGSGATAVTLVPELAKTAAHVTMLQRSPTYIVARPDVDVIANRLRKVLPAKAAYALVRWKNVLRGMYYYQICMRRPERAKQAFIDGVKMALPGYDVEKHFTPRYNPWTQRVCLAPNGDIFRAIKSGSVSVVTETIDRFIPSGIRLATGQELPADLIVTATGLNVQALGGVSLSVDGRMIDQSKLITYKGLMYSDVPNLASCFGYTNASWTLKCDLTCDYVCRLINLMDQKGIGQITPRLSDPEVRAEPWVSFSSGYVVRARDRMPKQGSKHPWRLHQNYVRDILLLRYGKLEDGTLELKPRGVRAQSSSPPLTASAAE